VKSRESDDKRWAFAAVATVFMLIVCAWGLWIAIFARSDTANLAAALLSGLIVGVCCCTMMLCGSKSSREVLGALGVLAVGITHVPWYVMVVAFLDLVGLKPAHGGAGIVLVGSVFAVTVGLATGARWTALAILGGTAALTAMTFLPSLRTSRATGMIAVGLLHLCIAVPVFVWTVRAIFREPTLVPRQNVDAG
jgi:hypothetical protein